jgi:hypothetical protein
LSEPIDIVLVLRVSVPKSLVISSQFDLSVAATSLAKILSDAVAEAAIAINATKAKIVP